MQMLFLSMRASDFTGWLQEYGISTAILIVIIFTTLIFLPKFWEEHKETKKRDQDQMDRLLNMQLEQTKAVTAALDRSNTVIESNSRVVEMNAKAYEQTQTALVKCTDTLDELSDKIEKSTGLNQKIYNEVILLQNNVQDVKEKVS